MEARPPGGLDWARAAQGAQSCEILRGNLFEMTLEAHSRPGKAGKVQSLEPALRPAVMNDVDGIHALIDEASRTSTVLPRSRDSVCENLRDYLVAEIDERLVGCGALHIWGVHLAEVRSLVVDGSRRGHGIGGRIVQGLIEEARRLHLQRLFVLTDSEAFFFRQGFVPVDRGTLPHKVWNECILCPKFEDCGEVSLEMKI